MAQATKADTMALLKTRREVDGLFADFETAGSSSSMSEQNAP
jgi:hypothetical protein